MFSIYSKNEGTGLTAPLLLEESDVDPHTRDSTHPIVTQIEAGYIEWSLKSL